MKTTILNGFLAVVALTPASMQGQQWSGGPLSWTSGSGTPATVVVQDSNSQWLATFTLGARTVPMRGNVRAFLDPSLTAAVLTSNVYVRILSTPFQGVTDQVQQWLSAELLNDASDDVLKIASQYVTGGPDSQTLGSYTPPPPAFTAGSSWYGPLIKPGEPGFDPNNMWVRHEGADWNDYLGITATYPNKNVAPVAANITSLDCSGFMRMVWGHRGGIPLDITMGTTAGAIPRRSWQIYSNGPGVVVQPYTGVVPNPVDSIVAYTTPTPLGNAALTSLLPGTWSFSNCRNR